MSWATRRPAQVLLPRGCVAASVEFSHRTTSPGLGIDGRAGQRSAQAIDVLMELAVADLDPMPARQSDRPPDARVPIQCGPASPFGVWSAATGDAGVYGFAACLSLNRAPRRMPSIP
jgi:hypothetical protein